jgi:hypothetical protein
MRRIISLISILILFQFTARSDEGMWIPLFLNDLNEAEMQAMGMNITAEDIYSINQSSLKDAIMIFGGGCTAELVSDQGLILTNHHCGYRRIQAHSSVEHDYLTDGFWAMDKSEELSNPGLSVTFLVRMEEVTERVLADITNEMIESVRKDSIRSKIDEIVEEATKDNHYKALVKPFYYGNRYFLFVNEEFEDVRLVGAPPSNIGKFGGDTDNWMWPRHTGDFSVFRIYADSSNQPAAYSENNVPYKPKSHLSVSLGGVEKGDFTFVFGYPGSTQEYIPSFAVDNLVNTTNPVRIGVRDKKIEIFKKYMNQSPEMRIQYSAKQASVSNGWKKWIGENRGIKRLKTIDQKREFEAEFTNWVNSSEELKSKYGDLLEEFEKIYSANKMLDYNANYIREAGFGVEIIRFATGFQRLVTYSKNKETYPKMLTEVERLKTRLPAYFKDYQVVVDKELFSTLLSDYYKNVEPTEIPQVLVDLNKKYKGDFETMAEEVFENSVFASEEKITAFLNKYKSSSAKKMEKDMAYKIAEGISNKYYEEYRPKLMASYNKIDSLMRFYMQAQIEMQPHKKIYPDANFTLRVAYGNVDGYNPDDAIFFNHFTTLDGIMEKEDPEIYDYVVEEKLKELYNAKDYGRYGDKDGSMHVCFTATNHTTGGNSGSPVLDADGNLIGINFDRCWEGTMSDIVYDITQCRNIAIDIRYCLFIIDKFAGAGHLVEEMTIVK